MNTIPALVIPREEWPDADFDLPEGQPLHSACGKDDEEDEDWDADMGFGQTGGPKARAVVASMAARLDAHNVFTIRPPLPSTSMSDFEEDDEGVSTIKVACLPKPVVKAPLDDDMEDAFALPDDLTQLSLAPLSLNHRSSKNSLEWGDKDQTSSSQSSDAYSTLGFAGASPSSNSTSSASCPDSETEDDEEDDGELDGLVIPASLFESGQGSRKLNKILEMKKKVQIAGDRIKVASPDPEDDFEIGLVIEDDIDLSPSRLLYTTQQQQSQRIYSRSNSMPLRPPTSLRPPSRLKSDRAKSPINPPPSSTRQFQKIRLTPSPPRPSAPSRAHTLQAPSSSPPVTNLFLSPKPGSLRGQKSHSGLKPPTPPSTTRKLTRKASLSSLMEASQSQASGSGLASGAGTAKSARYGEPTAASRAKTQRNSAGKISALEYRVPPARPSTPSSNPAALRLTMPTASRIKSRPGIYSLFSPTTPGGTQAVLPRANSPLPPRPPSTMSARSSGSRTPSNPQPAAPKILRRPKRPRTYGDGTELDGIDDLPTDGDKEGKYRVQPKAVANRIPGGTYSLKPNDKGTLRKKGKRESSNNNIEAILPSTNTLKRTGRIEFPSQPLNGKSPTKKRKNLSSPSSGQTRRKPTLIRNLGGASAAPKFVGDMKWNPNSLRWEGNDQVLRDFDAAIGTSTRPALITHLTGSSMGSPVGSFSSGARIVGNMMFDPARMCWISTLPPDEDEPDVFANLADDEDDDGWESKGGTIRASLLQQPSNPDSSISPCSSGNTSNTNSVSSSGTDGSSVEPPSPARRHTRTMSESESDRGSRASMVYDVDEAFLEGCKVAEARHTAEMRGWRTTLASAKQTSSDVFTEPDRSYLYEIRALATRKY